MIDFDALVESYLKTERRPKAIGRYFPSEVGQCMRKAWYSYKEPRETDSSLLRVFEAGNRVHEFVVDVLKSDKTPEIELIEAEMPVTLEVDNFVIAGRIDNMIKINEDGKKVLVEVKSTGNLSMVTEAKREHSMQLQIYMHALQMPYGALLYIEKNTFKSKVFTVNYDKEFTHVIIERFRKLHNFLVENKLPDPEARMVPDMNWMCNWCPYKEPCFGTPVEPNLTKWTTQTR